MKEWVWYQLDRPSFAVLRHATPSGQQRSSRVVYAAGYGRLFVAAAPTSWIALHIAEVGQIAVAVPIRRGAVLLPIPPATTSRWPKSSATV